jgi:hypothetical protein
MKKYAVINDKQRQLSALLARGLYMDPVTVNYFDTIDEAIEYASKLDVEVAIYESVAKVKIKHEIEMTNENNSNTTSVENSVS